MTLSTPKAALSPKKKKRERKKLKIKFSTYDLFNTEQTVSQSSQDERKKFEKVA